MITRKHWSVNEDKYLINSYGYASIKSIADDLGRSEHAVVIRATKLNLKGRRRSGFFNMHEMSSHDVWLMEQLRNEGLDLKTIGEKFDLPIGCVRYLLKEEMNAA